MDLKDCARSERTIAFVTVGYHGCWSFVRHTIDGYSSCVESHQRPAPEDLEACAAAHLPVVRFDRAPSFTVAAVCAYAIPLAATGNEPFDDLPHRDGRWGGFQRVPYLRRLRMLEALGIPVEWNGAVRPDLTGPDAVTVERLQQRLRSEQETRTARAEAEAREADA